MKRYIHHGRIVAIATALATIAALAVSVAPAGAGNQQRHRGPTAITKPASRIGFTSARLNGVVGVPSRFYFQYGTRRYDHKTRIQKVSLCPRGSHNKQYCECPRGSNNGQYCECPPGSNNGRYCINATKVAVWADISGLRDGTTYHFRIVAINGDGTTYGNDQTFTTLRPPPKHPKPHHRGGR